MSLRDQLQLLYDHYGELTPSIIVDEARPKTSPLHTYFEWDNKIAGEKYRQQQASDLIRKVKITYQKGDRIEQTRYFVSVQKEDQQRAYHPAEKVIEDEIATQIVLREMEREWKQLQNRYGKFKEFAELVRRSLEAA